MFLEGHNYRPSMASFLNRFSSQCRTISEQRVIELRSLFERFVESCASLPPKAFYGKVSGKFNVLLFECVFAAQTHALAEGRSEQLDMSRLDSLKDDPDFIEATQKSTTDKANVLTRLRRAQELAIG